MQASDASRSTHSFQFSTQFSRPTPASLHQHMRGITEDGGKKLLTNRSFEVKDESCKGRCPLFIYSWMHENCVGTHSGYMLLRTTALPRMLVDGG